MTSDSPEHQFDPDLATEFRPRPDFAKTAILVEPVAETTVLRTSFGEQSLNGPFYVIADGTNSYGAAQREFEAGHELVGPDRWVKRSPIHAYRAGTRTTVHTRVADNVESSVVAMPGDWIVRQSTGEVMVVTPAEFEARYEPADD